MRPGSHRDPSSPDDMMTTYIDEVFVDTTCDVCSAEFVEIEELRIHKEQVHPESTLQQDVFEGYKCYFCRKYYNAMDELALHIRDKHLAAGIYSCQYCLRTFKDFKKLKAHEQLHLSGKKNTETSQIVLSCSNCPKFLHSTKELQKHEYEKHKDANNGVLINDCFPYLTSCLNMRSHELLRALGRKSVTFACVCNIKMTDLTEYLHHLVTEGCQSLSCDRCCRPFRNRVSLKRHLKDSLCLTETKQCGVCRKNFGSLEFESHRLKCLRTWKCKNCNASFKTATDLKEHEKFHNQIIKIKYCFYCRLQLCSLKMYKSHVEKCHGKNFSEYKYPCAHCEKIFNHPQKLFGHYQFNHKDVNPFRCNICDKEFRVRKRFTYHIKMEHKSVGFVEFTEDLYVHFNKEKSSNAYQPLPREKLFTDEEEKEFEKAGLCSKERLIKPKRKVRRKKLETVSSDDEPLIKKRKVTPLDKIATLANNNKKRVPRLTCKICQKYCYTVQNYIRHVEQHFKGELSCVKCEDTFKTKKDLDAHLEEVHATAPITSKLKSLIEKKQLGIKLSDLAEAKSKRFEETVKRVPVEISSSATVKVVKDTAKNFLESFSVEVEKPNRIEIETSVTIKPAAEKKRFKVRIHKCDLRSLPTTKPELRMPERVNMDDDLVKAKVSLKTVVAKNTPPKMNFDSGDLPDDTENAVTVPEMGQEVVYQTKEAPQLEIAELEIPPLPEGHGIISVATIQSEAPYFKIVPLNELMQNEPPKSPEPVPETIELPTGTLVRTNPLAHLLKGRNINDVNKRNYYAPKLRNPHEALANALLKLADHEVKSVIKTKKVTRKKKNIIN